MADIDCKLCGHTHPDDPKACPCRCSVCGGEKDAEGWCPNYCLNGDQTQEQADIAYFRKRAFGDSPRGDMGIFDDYEGCDSGIDTTPGKDQEEVPEMGIFEDYQGPAKPGEEEETSDTGTVR